MSVRLRWVFGFVLTGAAGLGLAPGCLTLRDDASGVDENTCTRCHGSAKNSRDKLLQAAPPFDLKGNQEPAYPGVGAHAAHLAQSETHAPLACSECHEVPTVNDAPGHYDTEPPAEVVFGELSSTDAKHNRPPRYDAVSRKCSNTYCHGQSSPLWTEPRGSEAACGSCHGLPPAWPHPQAEDCSPCHGQVVDAAGQFVDANLHVDGRVQVSEPDCSSCHGDDGNAAPPTSLSGKRKASDRSVGAHQAHLSGGTSSRALACDECHLVPNEVTQRGHLDGSGIDVTFSGIGEGTRFDAASATCRDGWCHGGEGNVSPAWNEPKNLGCQSCHGMPPAAPHPPVDDCSLCHGDVFNEGEITARELHVDGVVQVDNPTECTSCHGDPDGDPLGAPPFDTSGSDDSSARGVGAHSAHLVGRGLARVLACSECHLVPEGLSDPGHVDSALPAEVRLQGVAEAFEAEPRYEAGACAQTYCHGDSFIGGRPSGGRHTVPEWTVVDESQITCGSCHGMPPPAPHPEDAADCGQCHKNARGSTAFSHPELHVDGKVTFFLSREQAAQELSAD